LSKQYLAGTLSPKENYQIEDRLLENDFSYQAFEGLGQVDAKQWQTQLEDTESRIIKEFGIHQDQGLTRNVTIGIAGLAACVIAAWFIFAPGREPLDLTADQVSKSAEASDQKESVAPALDTLSVKAPPIQEKKPEPSNKVKSLVKEPVKPKPILPKNVETHITVGRIVDSKGIPVVNATVSYGMAIDTTDKSGYYALKVSQGGIKVKVTHLTTPYLVEIDSHQNWEIVLDIAEQEVIDYYPMNAANRFK
jgi:hypothetical protein